MIEFSDTKPIYRQIVDFACQQILDRIWKPEERVPSVRELSAALGVNTRTVMKAMEELLDMEVISARRGMGYSLASDAEEKVRRRMKRVFLAETLPMIRREMKMLGILPEELLDILKSE